VVVGYLLSAGTAPGCTSFADRHPIGNPPHNPYILDGPDIELVQGTAYCVKLTALNSLMMESEEVESNAMFVDRTDPLPGHVYDWAFPSDSYQRDDTVLRASWAGFTDPDSGIIDYQVALAPLQSTPTTMNHFLPRSGQICCSTPHRD